MATKRSALRSARSIKSNASGISPNQTTWGRKAPARRQSGQTSATVKSSSHGRRSAFAATRLYELTMHVDDARGACALVQIVDVLRHQRKTVAALGERILEPREREMRRVGLGVPQVPTTQVIEREHRFRIAGESF